MDSRPKGRYDGVAPEPNPKIRSGHMLGSVNFPFTNIIDPKTKTLKNVDGLKEGKPKIVLFCFCYELFFL